MTGAEAKEWRQQLGIKQAKMCWELSLDPGLVSKWESGFARLRPEAIDSISRYIQSRLAEVRSLHFTETVLQ
jgi:transcriptional regulator with XRE-family HTH domain